MSTYTIIHLTPETNAREGSRTCAAHAVSLSGGLSSALAAERAIIRYGRDQVLLWFADTREEDEDLYRFLRDLMERFGGVLYYYTDGRRPLDIAEGKQIIPCNQLAPCSFELKIRPYREFIRAMPQLPTVIIGLDYWETRRLKTTRESYAKAMPQAIVEYPLLWTPIETRPLTQVCRQDWQIAPPRLYDLGFPHNNCFAGETRYITSEGIKTLATTCGQTVQVLTTGGVWGAAEIKSFGVQQLYAIRLQRFSEEKTIYATAGHRWITYQGRRSNQRRDRTTNELQPGARLVSLYSHTGIRVRPSAFGIAHGIVFGDGTKAETRWTPPAYVILCGEKNRELLQYFPLSPTTEVPGVGIKVNDLPRFFKDRPGLAESKSYLYGWLAGYFAADGTVARDGSIILHSASLETLLFVRDVCAILGIGTFTPRLENRPGIDGKHSPLYNMRIMRRSLTLDFFLLKNHRERAVQNPGREVDTMDWTVIEVLPTERVEEIYCAVVPETHCFTLEDNILTGNCGGACVRQGREEWKRLHTHFPQRYAAREAWEQAQREKGGARANRAFCRMQERGVKRPITLQEIRKRRMHEESYVGDCYQPCMFG